MYPSLPEQENLTSPPNSNYDAWAIQIEDLAMINEVWKIMNGKERLILPLRPGNVKEEAHLLTHQALITEQEKTDEDWEERSAVALALVRMNVTSTERTRVRYMLIPR